MRAIGLCILLLLTSCKLRTDSSTTYTPARGLKNNTYASTIKYLGYLDDYADVKLLRFRVDLVNDRYVEIKVDDPRASDYGDAQKQSNAWQKKYKTNIDFSLVQWSFGSLRKALLKDISRKCQVS